MTCKVNGELVDHRQSDEPIPEAMKMIDIACVNLDMLEVQPVPAKPVLCVVK